MTNRSPKAARLIETLKQILEGLENHPDALDNSKNRPRIPSAKMWRKKFMKFEQMRERGEKIISDANDKEEELLREVEDDIRLLRNIIRGRYTDAPEVLEDFFGRG